LLITLVAICGFIEMYFLHTNLSLSVMLLIDAIVLIGFLEGIIFHRGGDQDLNETNKRIAWTFILLLVNLAIFMSMLVEDAFVQILGAASLIIFMNFEQVGAFLVFKYDNRKQPQERNKSDSVLEDS
jgi:hypothetical protein